MNEIAELQKFSLIYADPPWQWRDKASAGKRGAEHKYPVLSVNDICLLDVPSIAAPDSLLAMWWVGAQPEEALKVVRWWGFELKTMFGFVWHKVTKNGLDAFGMGHLTRQDSECVLFATRGKFKRASASVRSFVEAPLREHSRKPDVVRERLVELVGDIPRIELFARQQIDGWTPWGNEVETGVEIKFRKKAKL